MFETMRARLTLWYTCVLALVLVVFALATYAYLARAARESTDQSLADTADALVSNFIAESDDEDQSGDDAAAEVTRGFQFDKGQAFVFDEVGRLVAASDTPPRAESKPTWPAPPPLSQSMSTLIESAARTGRAYSTLFRHDGGIRAVAVKSSSHEQTYVIVIARSLHDQNEALEHARDAFCVAVPLALLVASLGGYFLARKSLAPVVAMGARAARIGASNLSERLPVSNARNELGRLALVFNELLSRLDLSFEQQRRFMADASHELRTPVAIVCGESEVALSQSVRSEEAYRESLSILNDEGRRLTRIVEDLFTLTRADAGQYRFAPINFYLDETVGECVRAVRSLASQHGLELEHRQTVGELLFRGDEELIRRLVLNLLDNAIKYTPSGGHVLVELESAPSSHTIRITDTGTGIPAEAQPHVFERFYRADKARTRDGGARGSGAGLGLSIASWVAEMHGGTLKLERSDNSGTTFIVSLPASYEPFPA